ncbi:HvnC protein [Citrobacter amalonaticus]|uniref:HvnC protein n=1 Tax=Citrobacter amalonaticus TaxID=35703 RepID=UPI00300C4CFC
MKLFKYVILLFIFSVPVLASAHDYSINKLSYFKTHTSRGEKRLSGTQTAAYLNEDYSNIQVDCGESTTPAFLCTGVLLRGTDSYSSTYHSWDPSPSSVTSGGVSFSYLRADSKYNKLSYSYNNGFIFFPYFYAPDGEGIDTNIDIMCSFPIDAATENRDNKGCGASNSYPTQSVPCQQQNITTASEWYNHYIEGKMDHRYQCGFLTNDNSSYNTADAFYQSILSMSTISSESFNEQNELRLATWAQGKQDSLPIEAFFYIAGSNQGLNSARSTQQDFYNSTVNKIWVPVIELILPTTPEQNATFEFNTADQLIPEPATLQN